MISPLLAKLYGIIWEKRLAYDQKNMEKYGKISKGQAILRSYHSTMDHRFTLRIIVEKCFNNKIDLLCCFIDLRKSFHMVPKTNLWNRLEELKVTFELRAIAMKLYENVVAKIRNTKGW
jgi:hypothetical protein